ncbi:hypothetical protein [Desulfolucanica intricata]|uniref:hypothetical protein n=1 Tax=Desulfolucanica intricata TaxID=1285191 RepID=UPI0009EECE26
MGLNLRKACWNQLAPTLKTYLRYDEIIQKSVIPELGQIIIEKLRLLYLQSYVTEMSIL